jgi:hypothetical protein
MIEKPIASKDIAPKKEFHFPGSGKYVPQTILAALREEAEKIWLQTRKPMNPEEKVENINNQENK